MSSSSVFGQTKGSSSEKDSANDAANFECNICFELAQDPIVTLCGHLYCWPCLYEWLHVHSRSQECPVCKALVEEDKLVPLYGRGKAPSDPRSKRFPGVNIPNRPSGQRPETAPPPQDPQNNGFGFSQLGGNFSVAAVFGPFFSFNVHHVSTQARFRVHQFGFLNSFYHGGHSHGPLPRYLRTPAQRADDILAKAIFLVGLMVIISLVFPFW